MVSRLEAVVVVLVLSNVVLGALVFVDVAGRGQSVRMTGTCAPKLTSANLSSLTFLCEFAQDPPAANGTQGCTWRPLVNYEGYLVGVCR